jgi:hypothetical protein
MNENEDEEEDDGDKIVGVWVKQPSRDYVHDFKIEGGVKIEAGVKIEDSVSVDHSSSSSKGIKRAGSDGIEEIREVKRFKERCRR